jgi:hypothetical protein
MTGFISKISFLDTMITQAKKSDITYRLSACLMQNFRLVQTPTYNTSCTTVKGCRCPSLHAEHRALLNFYSDSLFYSKAKGWCFLPKGWKHQKEKV